MDSYSHYVEKLVKKQHLILTNNSIKIHYMLLIQINTY